MALRECFVLGSGFSKAINSQLPTLKDLSKGVWKRLASYMNGPEDMVKTEPFEENVEYLLSYLNGNYPWLTEAEQLQNRRDFVKVVQKIVTEIKAKRKQAFQPKFREEDLPDWVGKLLTYWHEDKSSIITLNYDTCIERLFQQFAEKWVDRESGFDTKEFYPVKLEPPEQGGYAHVEFDTFNLYKLHGSTNWFYSGNDSYPGERIKYVDLDGLNKSHDEKLQERLIKDLEPLIVPPITDKSSIYQNTNLRLLWKEALKPLNNAQNIYFLGYSLPITDMTMRFFFASITNPGIQDVYVVNSPEVLDRYGRLLDGNNFAIETDYTDRIDNSTQRKGPIPDFVGDLIQGDL